jgi:hypothetical protein
MSLETAQAAAAKQHPGITVRQDGDTLVYAANGTDLLKRNGLNYVLLIDCPKYQMTKGHYALSGPDYDHSAACTARDLADAM